MNNLKYDNYINHETTEMIEKNILRILFVEDSEMDRKLTEQVLVRNGLKIESDRIDTEKLFREKLITFYPDLIISDYSMPSFDGMSALKISREIKPDIPFIILTGSTNEEIAVECMKAGADDYIIKENMSRLSPAIVAVLKKYENMKAAKDAQEALLESEQRFRSLFTNNLAVMLLIDPESLNIVDANEAAEKFYGWNRLELLSMSVDMINTLSIEEVKEEMNRATTQKRVQCEFKHRKADKSLCNVEVLGSTINFSGKEYLHIIVHDITERKKAEEALKISDKMFNHSIDMLGIIDSEDFFKVLNPAWEKTVGYTRKELFSKPWNYFVFHDDKSSTENIKSTVIDDREIYKFEIRFLCKDGTVKWLAWNMFQYPDEELMFVIARDVSDAKLQQEKLTTLSRAVQQSPVSIIITDPIGNIEYVNPKVTEVTGYKPEDVIGQTPRIFKSGYQSESFYKKLWETILSGNQWQDEIQNKKKDGELFWENAIISPIVNSQGEIINFVAIKEDITEKKKMIEELVSAKEKAELSNRLKTEFLAQMSHEIRSPLNAVISLSSIIKSETIDNTNENMEIAFDGISSASIRIIRTIDAILNMSELQLGLYRTLESKINLIEVIDNLKREFNSAALNKKLEFTFEKCCEKAEIISDDYAINQIFSNLIDNALKYTESGYVKISIDNYEKGYQVIVKDSGIGIAKEYLPEIFSSFTQEEQGYTRRYEGNGLGLALVKNYCDLIGAKISVESKKNIGSEFKVSLISLSDKV